MIDFLKKNSRIIFVNMIGPFLGSACFLVFYAITGGNGGEVDYPFATIISLSVTLIANIAGTTLLIGEMERKSTEAVNSSLKKLEDSVSASLRSMTISIEDEANRFRSWQADLLRKRFRIEQVINQQENDRIDRSLAMSTVVKNTFVDLYHLTGNKTPQSDRVRRMYKNFLEKEFSVNWIDICGVEDFLDGRFHGISVDNYQESGRHEVAIISNSAPIINFMILGDKEKLTEVYFGWLPNDRIATDIYRSKDERIIKLFDKYFSTLYGSCSSRFIVDYSKNGSDRFNSVLVNAIRGTWLSVSISNSASNSKSYSTFAIVQFHVVGGEWHVRGTVFERSSRKRIHEFKSVSVSVYDGGLFYRFERSNPDGSKVAKGHGTYQLSASDPGTAIGLFVVIGDPKRSVQDTRAVKISDNWHEGPLELQKEEVDSYIDRIQMFIDSQV